MFFQQMHHITFFYCSYLYNFATSHMFLIYYRCLLLYISMNKALEKKYSSGIYWFIDLESDFSLNKEKEICYLCHKSSALLTHVFCICIFIYTIKLVGYFAYQSITKNTASSTYWRIFAWTILNVWTISWDV